MAAAGPFEAQPRLAVAVSGGADSVALCLLADDWVRARSGRILALTVDHGIRPAAASEADLVHTWLTGRGIEHETLRWNAETPRSGVEAKARRARYRLLFDACRRHGILHLLVGHHRDDQVETVLMRSGRGSGPHGVAAMGVVVETRRVRVVRPLLSVSPLRLRAYCQANGQPWIDDPSNLDGRFFRGRIRTAMAASEATGRAGETALALAERCGNERAADEQAVAALLARCCRLHPAGFGVVDPAVLNAAPSSIASLALARIATTIGGKHHAPSFKAIDRLRTRLQVDDITTLGRCLWQCLPARASGGDASRIVVCREARGLPQPVALVAGREWIWDGRFTVRVVATESDSLCTLRLGPLGEAGWREAAKVDPASVTAWRQRRLPRPAVVTLPALRDQAGLVAVPTLDWWRKAEADRDASAGRVVAITFDPLRSLSGTGTVLA